MQTDATDCCQACDEQRSMGIMAPVCRHADLCSEGKRVETLNYFTGEESYSWVAFCAIIYVFIYLFICDLFNE